MQLRHKPDYWFENFGDFYRVGFCPRLEIGVVGR